MSDGKSPQIGVRLKPYLHRAVLKAARDEGRSKSQLVQRAISLYIEGKTAPDKAAVKGAELMGILSLLPPDVLDSLLRYMEYLVEQHVDRRGSDTGGPRLRDILGR